MYFHSFLLCSIQRQWATRLVCFLWRACRMEKDFRNLFIVGLGGAVSDLFRNFMKLTIQDIHPPQRCDWSVVQRQWQRSQVFHLFRNYFCCFSCEHPSATLWKTSRRDCLKMCKVCFWSRHSRWQIFESALGRVQLETLLICHELRQHIGQAWSITLTHRTGVRSRSAFAPCDWDNCPAYSTFTHSVIHS